MVESALIPAPELEAERAFLAEARAALARMHPTSRSAKSR